MKTFLFLGGFPQMIDVVMIAKKMGVYTMLADRDPKSPAKRFVDKAFHLSTDNVDVLEKLCRDEKIDTVTASGDYSHMLIRVCMISESYEELCDSVSKVKTLIKVESTEGEDMLACRFDLKEGV